MPRLIRPSRDGPLLAFCAQPCTIARGRRVMKKNRGERRSGYAEVCVYLRAKEINLSIVRDGELLENIFFVFSKKIMDGEERW